MEKIVVTGYGVKAPKTNNVQRFLYNLANGINCLETVTNLSPKVEETIVGKVNEGLQEFESDKRFKSIPKDTLMGMAAGKEAMNQAALTNLKD